MNSQSTKVIVSTPTNITVPEKDFEPFFVRCLNSVREEMRDSPYVLEGLRVLGVHGYRSAIGNFWNAVVDDLRNKIIARSLPLFNKTMSLRKEIKSYEDFQNHVNDDELIEGAYKIGVIGWEASKVLKHAKETRHIFDGHPRSSEPTVLKVLTLMEDCVKYVLAEEPPAPIIDLDQYVTKLGDAKFARNAIGVESAFGELPEIYKEELANRLYTAYVHPNSSTVLRSNIEFVLPILWTVLPKAVKIQVVRRIDQEIGNGDAPTIEQAFSFVKVADAIPYLSLPARKYKLLPLVKQLEKSLDNWAVENSTVRELTPYASIIPQDLLAGYVSALVHTYVGRIGSSLYFSRTDFYADGAASAIPGMMEAFDDRAAEAFVACMRESEILRNRIHHAAKLRRLRALGNIVLGRISENFVDKQLLELLVDETREREFTAALYGRAPR